MLSGIWWGAWILCGVAVVALAVLIGVRAYRRHGDLRDRELSRTLSRELIIWLGDAAHDISALRRFAVARPAFIEQLLFRTAALVEGEEHARLIGLAHDLGLEQRLIHTVRHGRTARRRQAAETLAMFDTADAVNALRASLADKHPAVRLAAARSLATQGHTVPLSHFVEDPMWFGDSILIQDVFNKLAVHQSEDLVALSVNETVAAPVRARAVRSLASTGQYEFLTLFLSMAAAQQATVREAAAFALGTLEHPRAATVLPALLSDPDPSVRAAASEAAARIALPSLAPELERALSDENWWVRSRAADALGALGEAGLAVLSRVAQGPVSPARDAAALNLSGKAEPQ